MVANQFAPRAKLLMLIGTILAGLSLLASPASQAQTTTPATPAPVYLPLITNNSLTTSPSAPTESSLTATSSVTAEIHLTGTIWTLVSWGALGATIPVTVTSVTLQFRTDGHAFGRSFCNYYDTTYVVQNNTLTLKRLSTTLMSCGDELDSEEMRHLAALKTAHEFTLTGNQLMIQYDDGQSVLNFTGVALPTSAVYLPLIIQASPTVTPVPILTLASAFTPTPTRTTVPATYAPTRTPVVYVCNTGFYKMLSNSYSEAAFFSCQLGRKEA